ncbi:MAG: hypothetical protein CM1200mP9_09590 [Gammaproteobacteria bacterium]|nr:MAG: hypothetical protein CM1200mP9_09590 [Gammaproteobacteria bacterium]
MGVMTDEEKFRFDLHGFLVIRSVLSREECKELSMLADSVWPEQADDDLFRRTEDISRWHPSFLNLIDHPKCCLT